MPCTSTEIGLCCSALQVGQTLCVSNGGSPPGPPEPVGGLNVGVRTRCSKHHPYYTACRTHTLLPCRPTAISSPEWLWVPTRTRYGDCCKCIVGTQRTTLALGCDILTDMLLSCSTGILGPGGWHHYERALSRCGKHVYPVVAKSHAHLCDTAA